MTKINITTPTGVESLSLLSAFKVDDNKYVVFDSEKTSSMGLPLIYVSKFTTKLEQIIDKAEWEKVKSYLKGIINGTSFEYIKLEENLTSNEVYYTPLTLPSTNAFDAIKNGYVLPSPSAQNIDVPTPPSITPEVAPPVEVKPVEPAIPNIVPPAPSMPEAPQITPPLNIPTPPVVNENVIPTTPIMHEAPAISNEVVNRTPVVPEVPSAPIVEPITPEPPKVPNVVPSIQEVPQEEVKPLDNDMFKTDKETFLKACENMFDALASKYQKELENLQKREMEIKRQETEIANKMASASEHLANAEAREQVANIAHDNAQKIMDINNLMPNMNNTTTIPSSFNPSVNTPSVGVATPQVNAIPSIVPNGIPSAIPNQVPPQTGVI